jgi:hypothetical protein
VKLLRDLGYCDTDGNETSDELVRQRSGSGFGCSAKYESVGTFSSLGRVFWMPTVHTMYCSASMDCDQIFTELVEKQVQDFYVIDNDNRTLFIKPPSSQNRAYTKLNLQSVLNRSGVNILWFCDSGNFVNAYYGLTDAGRGEVCRDTSFHHIDIRSIKRNI